jgi:hypothetical protein
MLALALDPKIAEAGIDQMRVRYQPGDLDAVIAMLTASPMSAAAPVEGIQSDNPEEPPPRALFALFDRPMPQAGPELSVEQLPVLLAYALLYGRQTDREPRLELMCQRPFLERAKTAIQKIVGDTLGHVAAEEVAGFLPAQPFAYAGQAQLPPNVPPEQILALNLAERRRYLNEQWPNEPNFIFGGRTPGQAASDRTSRATVLAAIGLWELNQGHSLDFDELRRHLDLPPAEPIDPSGTEVDQLPLVRLHRLDAKKLSDEQLSRVWRRTVLFRARLATFRLAPEVASRESMPQADRAQAEGVMASFTTDFAKGLAHLSAARKLAKEAGISCAGWDLEELSLRFTTGKLDGFMGLVQHISSAHRNEPGVQERLFQFLYELGIVDEQGRLIRREAPAASELVVPGGDAAAAGKIWTPESETGEKKALWVPGA